MTQKVISLQPKRIGAPPFARGGREWRALKDGGLTVSFMDDGCDCQGAGTVVAAPSVRDVAQGLIQHLNGREVDLRRWASVMLAASAVIDLRKLEDHPDGERLISALWEASGGEAADEDLVKVARRLAS